MSSDSTELLIQRAPFPGEPLSACQIQWVRYSSPPSSLNPDCTEHLPHGGLKVLSRTPAADWYHPVLDWSVVTKSLPVHYFCNHYDGCLTFGLSRDVVAQGTYANNTTHPSRPLDNLRLLKREGRDPIQKHFGRIPRQEPHWICEAFGGSPEKRAFMNEGYALTNIENWASQEFFCFA